MPRKKVFKECTVCGKQVDSRRISHCIERGLAIMCTECSLKQAAEKRKKKSAERNDTLSKAFHIYCQVCGKEIPWKPEFSCAARIPKTCSRSCGTKLAAKDRTYTEESLRKKLTDFIKSSGRQLTYKEIIEGVGIKTTLLQKFGISLLALQKEILGIQCDRIHRKTSEYTEEDLMGLNKKFGLSGDPFSNVRILYRSGHGIDAVREYVRVLIGSKERYVGVQEFMRKSNMSFEAISQIDILTINSSLGYKRDRRSAAEDDLYEELCLRFGDDEVSREHTFFDCRGPKGWPLRFDFFLPKHNTLIELDGGSHMEGNGIHKDYTDVNRAVKKEYAKQHGLRLLVYTYENILEVKTIIEKIVLDVLKPVELLETQEGQSATKPVSNPEGSETIESYG